MDTLCGKKQERLDNHYTITAPQNLKDKKGHICKNKLCELFWLLTDSASCGTGYFPVLSRSTEVKQKFILHI